MHYGTVKSIDGAFLEAVVALSVYGENAAAEFVEFVIDTGFTEDAALPLNIINRLGLPPAAGAVEIALADGSVDRFERYTAYILWHNRLREVRVLDLGSEPLLGMELLRGCNISIDADPGGAVTIAELSAPA